MCRRASRPDESTVSVFWGGRSATFNLGLREKYWREHVKDMLLGTDAQARPCLMLDPITARQFIDRGGFKDKKALIRWLHETAEMPAGRYWDLQLVQNYIYPRATYGEEPFALEPQGRPERTDPLFPGRRHQRGGRRRRDQRLLADHGLDVSQDRVGRRVAVVQSGTLDPPVPAKAGTQSYSQRLDSALTRE